MKGRVLLCALDWGLGHATRSLALLGELERCGFSVVIASSGAALTLMRLELPGNRFYELPGYGISYSNSFSFEWGMLMQSRKVLDAVSHEHAVTLEILRKEKIDIIISDNRYGCFDSSVHSIFLSHQLHIMLSSAWRLLSPVVNALHMRMVSKFHEVWVPDFPDHVLSGELSRSSLQNLTFIGSLSTMTRLQEAPEKELDFIAVISGPEPERARFSDMLFRQLNDSGKRFLLVEGKPGTEAGSGRRANFVGRKDLSILIQKSSFVISRSGYSTIMDMAALGGKAIFVPTPGQTEQEYLARRMDELGIASWQTQDNFDLAQAIEDTDPRKGFDLMIDRKNTLLAKAISNLATHGILD